MPTFPIVISNNSTILQFISPCAGGQQDNLGRNGPYVLGNARYLVGLFTDLSFNTFISVIKSTDLGQTWTIQDQAGSQDGNAVAGLGAVVSTLDADGIRIWVVFRVFVTDASNQALKILVYNTSTDTWGSVLDTVTLPTPNTANATNDFAIAQNSNGDIVAAGNFFSFVFAGDGTFYDQGGYIIFSGTWGSFTQFSIPPLLSPTEPQQMSFGGMVAAGSLVHCFFRQCAGSTFGNTVPTYHQSLSGAVLGSLDTVTGGDWDPNASPLYNGGFSMSVVFDSSTGLISVSILGLGVPIDKRSLFIGSVPNTATLALTLTPFDLGLAVGRIVIGTSITVFSPGVLYTFYSSSLSNFSDTDLSFLVNYANPVTLGLTTGSGSVTSIQASPAPSITGFAVAITGSQFYWEQAGVPPPVPTPTVINKSVGGGATYFPRFLNKTLLLASVARIYGTDWVLPRDIPFPPLSSFFLFPNQFDLCLSREFQLYSHIDPLAMSCAGKPDCFLQSERDWLDYPPGWITFNPVNSIPLPAPVDGEVVILSFRVPYGYDGAILAQYHSYTGGFTEGSGDIQFRVRADGRYLRDMGDMEVTIGSPKQLSPVYGGLQLRSGNLVEYITTAPNTSGLLPPPGTGNILAGLHGIFYPRM